MILINNISFGCTKLYSGNAVVEVKNDDVHVSYVVVQDGNEIEGELFIDFDEYKHMNHDDLLNAVKDKFNKTVKTLT